MLTIKLAKVGKKNKKVFRIIISEKARDPYGKALEILGSYNPYSKELKVKADRVKYWVGQGSTMTPSINNLFVDNKIVEGKKEKNSKVGTANKRKVEKLEKNKQKAEAEKKAEETPIAEEVKNPATENTPELIEASSEEKSTEVKTEDNIETPVEEEKPTE